MGSFDRRYHSLLFDAIYLELTSFLSRGCVQETIFFLMLIFITFAAGEINSCPVKWRGAEFLKPIQTVGSQNLKEVEIGRRVRERVEHYLEWYLFWRELHPIFGFMCLIIFFDLTLALSVLAFLSLISFLNLGLGSIITWNSIISAALTLIFMLCLGNAAHELEEAVRSLECTYVAKVCTRLLSLDLYSLSYNHLPPLL
jgi:hypothetical protein